MTTFFNHLCGNCGVWLQESDPAFCPACRWLQTTTKYRKRMWGETEGLVNRRWQMRFNRGEIGGQENTDAGVLWERKQKDQNW